MNKIAQNSEIQEFEIDSQSLEQICQPNSDTSSLTSDQQSQQRSSWLLSDLEKLEPDPIMPNLFQRVPLDLIDKENESIREKQRPLSLFQFYPNQNLTSNLLVENRLNPPPPREPECSRVFIRCTQLKFDLEIEPVWASMALYDLKQKKSFRKFLFRSKSRISQTNAKHSSNPSRPIHSG